MNDLLLAPLFAGLLNSFTMRAENWVYNWLTPVWILGLGALVGSVAVLLLWGIGWLVSRVPAIADMASTVTSRWIGGSVLGIVILGLWSPLLWRQMQDRLAQQALATSPVVEAAWIFIPAAILSLMIGVGCFALCSRRIQDELPLLFQEGTLFWNGVVIAGFALYGIFGVVFVRDPDAMLDSLRRWPELGRSHQTFVVKAATDDNKAEQEFAVDWRRAEIRQLEFTSNESLRVAAYSLVDKGNPPSFDISGGETYTWKATNDPNSPLANLENIKTIYIRNLGDQDAQLTITMTTAPAIPEMLSVPILAVSVVALFFLYIVIFAMLPKVASIGLATAKSEMNTPFYIILVTAGLFLLFMFLWLPYNTFGEDIKMLKFTALDIIRMLALLQTVWSASSSVADEVEGKTALTVLSKPVGRRDFILGKFLGIAWMTLTMFVAYGAMLLLCIAYKPVYDVREGGKTPERPSVADPLGMIDVTRETGLTAEEVNWQICTSETVATIPALFLVYCEALVMAAVSVAISTRLGLVANFTICLAVFALGHLTPLLVQANVVAEKFEAVIFIGQLIATVLPVLDYFDSSAAIAQGKAVQIAYVGVTLVYTTLFAAISMLLALVLFEDRDLA